MSVETVTDSSFDEAVIKVSKKKLVVVEFSTKEKLNRRGEPNASAKMDSVIDELYAYYAGKVVFCRVEIELDSDLKDTLNPDTSGTYGINHGPTMILVLNGKQAGELVGQQTRERMVQVIDDVLLASLQKSLDWVEERINLAANSIVDKKTTSLDEIAFGKLGVLLTLRRVLKNKATPQDIGMLDAINDVLQMLEVLQADETFIGKMKP
ncbi:thioredoxin-like superfamily, group II member protein [Pseudomonas alliivorans]|nr:thioredoxin-like superfamily, group II member protein [Pseudomonas alliivorans]MEE4574231.1 thioredoxin-like superfamily, group II member protein [Pseudomonas alliivorans]MEE4744469.1 thioredoxin-like superfamily, group II member protein [Pseudomonas alliivorans]